MRNYERSIARGAAISTSIKTSADCNSTRKRAAINRKYIVHQCVRQLTREYNYAHVHMTPRVSCACVCMCANPSLCPIKAVTVYMHGDKPLRLHVEMALSSIFQESNT